MSVPVTFAGETIKVGTPVPLLSIQSAMKPGLQVRVSSDSPYATIGERFLVAETEVDPRASTINLLLNWTATGR